MIRYSSIFLAFIIVAGLGKAAQLEGEQLCQLGPLYQCQNVNSSFQCEAFNECIPHWKESKASALVSKEFYCNFCSLLMVDVQSALRANQTKAAVTRAVNRLCSEISHEVVAAACHKLANTYLSIAMDLLAKEISPSVVCRAVHACSGSAFLPQNFSSVLRVHFKSQRLTRILNAQPGAGEGVTIYPGMERFYMKPTTPAECVDCKQFVMDVKARLISNLTEQQLEAIFNEAVCSALPPALGNLCRDVVHLYIQKLVTMLDQELNPQEVCAMLGFCDANHLKILIKVANQLQRSLENQVLSPNVKSVECALCKGVLSRARMLLDDPMAQKKIRDLIVEEMCPYLSSLGNKCQLLADLYVPTLIRILSSEIDPMVICTEIHVCSGPANLASPAPQVPEIQLPPLMQKQLTSNGGLGTAVVGELSTCSLCDVLMQVVHKRGLHFVRTRAGTVAALREVCVLFPDNVAHRCDQLVDREGMRLIGYLHSQRSSTSAPLCPLSECHPPASSDTLLFQPAVNQPHTSTPANPTTGNSFTCDICKQAVRTAESYLRQNRTEEEIEAYLMSWCQSVPQRYQEECSSLVKQYLPYIIDALVTEADPQIVCEELDLCATQMYHKLLGRRRCTWGPTYWCASLLKAHRCQAVQHCQKQVWRAEKPARRT